MCETHSCARCGEALPHEQRRGRPRKYCASCRPLRSAEARLCQYCGDPVLNASRYPTCPGCADARRRDSGRRRDPQEPQVCAECGNIFYGRKRKMCGSLACKRLYNTRKAREWRSNWTQEDRDRRREYDRARSDGNRRRRKPRTCEICRAAYEPSYGDQRTCSRACGVELRRREYGHATMSLNGQSSAVPWKRCAVCAEPFVGRHGSIKRCALCRRLPYAAPVSPTPRTCAECGIDFLGKGKRIYCTTRCAKSAVRRLGKERRKGRIQEGDRINRFGWRRLAKRHGLNCHICGEPCDPQADPCKDDWAPTVDHVVPISMGGTHTFDNARIAHRYCNSIRGAASVEEARQWLAA